MFCKNCGEQLPFHILQNHSRYPACHRSHLRLIQVHNRKLAAQSGAQPAAEEQQQQKQAPKPAKESQSAARTSA